MLTVSHVLPLTAYPSTVSAIRHQSTSVSNKNRRKRLHKHAHMTPRTYSNVICQRMVAKSKQKHQQIPVCQHALLQCCFSSSQPFSTTDSNWNRTSVCLCSLCSLCERAVQNDQPLSLQRLSSDRSSNQHRSRRA